MRDMETVCNAEFIPWERLEGRTILITGATGLIGHALVNSLLYANKKRRLNLKVKALVRDMGRAMERFREVSCDEASSMSLGTSRICQGLKMLSITSYMARARPQAGHS